MRKFSAIVLAVLAVYHCGSAQEVEMEVDSNLEDGTFDALEYPIHHAVSIGDIDAVRVEIENGADLNVKNNHGWTPLMFAVEHGRPEIFDMLLDANVDVDIQEDDGWTALMFAGFHGDVGMVDRILADGGSALAVNNYGYAAHTITHNREHFELAERIATAGVQQALATDDLDTCIALIQEGADVHAQNENGWTTLTLAASLNRVGEVGWLLHDKQANPNWMENDGWSPLMFAANNDFYEVAELLVQAGADVSQQSTSGASAVSLAEEHQYTALLELFSSAVSYRPRDEGSDAEPHQSEEQQQPAVTHAETRHTAEGFHFAAGEGSSGGSASAAAAAAASAAASSSEEKHPEGEKKKGGFSFWN